MAVPLPQVLEDQFPHGSLQLCSWQGDVILFCVNSHNFKITQKRQETSRDV